MFQFISLFENRNRLRKLRVFGLAAMLSATFLGQSAIAQDVSWKNGSGGEFSIGGNWDSGAMPTSAENAMFLLNATYGVKLTSNATVQSFQQLDGDITMFGGNRLLANQESNFNSILTVSDVGTEFRGLQNLLIGSGGATSSGIVVVKNNALFRGANIFLGATPDGKNDSGVGLLRVDSGATVQVGNENFGFNVPGGQLVVSDTGTNGSFVVRNGSTVDVGQTSMLGLSPNGKGTVEVTGKGSQFLSQGFVVGLLGEGQFSVDASALASTSSSTLASEAGSIGTVIVSGGDSGWNNSGQMLIGRGGDGTLQILDGADVTSGETFLGNLSGSNGIVTMSGSGSNLRSSNFFMGAEDANTNGGEGQLNIGAGSFLRVGNDSTTLGPNSLMVSDSGTNGNLIVRNRSKITNAGDAVIGYGVNDSGTTILTGNGTQLTNAGDLVVGSFGSGRMSILDGSAVSNANGAVASAGNSSGNVTVDGVRSTWTNAGDLSLGAAGNATLVVSDRGSVVNQDGFMGAIAGGTGDATVRDAGSGWTNRNLFMGTRNGVTNDGVGTAAIESGGILQVGNDTATALSVSQLVVSDTGTNGNLHVRNGSKINNDGVSIFGFRDASHGNATINGFGSELSAGTDLVIGLLGRGEINVENGGSLTNDNAVLGQNSGSLGLVNVVQPDSNWTTNSQLVIGSQGRGFMNVLGGGTASADFTILGQQASSEASLNVNGAGSRFESTSGMAIGSQADAGMTVQSGGTVNSGTTVLGFNSGVTGSVNVSGAGSRWNATGDVHFGNDGAGELTINEGGVVAVSQSTTVNQLSQIMMGNGDFHSGSGTENAGTLVAMGGTANIYGNLVNQGRIGIGDTAILNFHDAVAHNGAEISTTEGGSTNFLGEYSGAGEFTGTGDVMFESNFRPGNSPSVIDFAGDVFFGEESNLFFELAGMGVGEFDRLNIAGDLSLDGMFDVELINGFALGLNQEFLVADVAGSLSGQFIGLGEGGLVGNFGGQDLFISYAGGNGNDVRLFTAVPEPGATTLLGLLCCGFLMRRRRRDCQPNSPRRQ